MWLDMYNIYTIRDIGGGAVKKVFIAGLEMLRIILVCLLVGGLIGFVVIENIYPIWNYPHEKDWMGALGILVLMFVLYRNRLQFNGFYRSEKNAKLSPAVTTVLITVSVIMLAMPPIIGKMVG